MGQKQENKNARYPDLNKPGPLSKAIEQRTKKKRADEDIQWHQDAQEDAGAHKQHTFAMEGRPQSRESADAAATLMSHYADAHQAPASGSMLAQLPGSADQKKRNEDHKPADHKDDKDKGAPKEQSHN